MQETETRETGKEYVGEGGTGLGDRIVSVLMAPRELAAALLRKPAWLWALVIVAVVTAACAALVARENAEFRRDLLSVATRIPQERLDKMGEVTSGTYVSSAIWSVFLTTVLALLYAAVLRGAARLLKGKGRYKTVFSLVSHAMLIGALGLIVATVVTKLTGTYPVETSVGVLAGDSYWSLARAALGNLEVFWLWQVTVLTIGLAVLEGFSLSKAVICTGTLFVVRMLVLVGIMAVSRGFLGIH